MAISCTDIRHTHRFVGKWIVTTLVLAYLSICSSAHADGSTFLLQLGTFSSEADAVKKWDDVKAHNTDLLGNLTLHVAEVTIPPGNTISFRTQAGPISSHEQASNLCATLQRRTIECNVVETALFTEETPSASTSGASVATPVVTAATDSAAPQEEKHSWFGSLFSSSGSNKPTPAAPAPTAAPVAEVAAAAPVAPAPAEAVTPAPANNTYAAAPIAAEHAAPPAPQYVPGREMHFLDAEPLPPSEPTTSEAAASPAVTEVPVGSAEGKVNVAEAIHVPLSDNKKHVKVVAQLPAVHGKGGTPSSSSAKLFWAQISHFNSEEEARGFYATLIGAYPQFSEGLRVRITHPYSARADARVSLRVGPFDTIREVHTVCEAAHASSEPPVHCILVRDLGNSSAVVATRSRASLAPAYTANADASPENATGANDKFWVQLGSYPSRDAAWETWDTLKDANEKLLKNVKASVSAPVTSSASRMIFRLRAGPFINESAANILCDKLSATGVGCIVLNDQ